MSEDQYLKATVAASYSGSTVNGDKIGKEVIPSGKQIFLISLN